MAIVVPAPRDNFAQGFTGAFNAFSSARDRQDYLDFEKAKQVEVEKHYITEDNRQRKRDRYVYPLLAKELESADAKSKMLAKQTALIDAQTNQMKAQAAFAASEQEKMMSQQMTDTTKQQLYIDNNKNMLTLYGKTITSKYVDQETKDKIGLATLGSLAESGALSSEIMTMILGAQEEEQGPGILERIGNVDPFGLRQGISQWSQGSPMGGMGAPATVSSAAARATVEPGTQQKKSSGEQIRDHYIDVVREWWKIEPGEYISKGRRNDAMHEARLRYMKQVSGGR